MRIRNWQFCRTNTTPQSCCRQLHCALCNLRPFIKFISACNIYFFSFLLGFISPSLATPPLSGRISTWTSELRNNENKTFHFLYGNFMKINLKSRKKKQNINKRKASERAVFVGVWLKVGTRLAGFLDDAFNSSEVIDPNKQSKQRAASPKEGRCPYKNTKGEYRKASGNLSENSELCQRVSIQGWTTWTV